MINCIIVLPQILFSFLQFHLFLRPYYVFGRCADTNLSYLPRPQTSFSSGFICVCYHFQMSKSRHSRTHITWTQGVKLVYFPLLTYTCHRSYLNLAFQSVHDFPPCLCVHSVPSGWNVCTCFPSHS